MLFFDGKEKGEQGLGAGQEVGEDGGGGEGVASDCVRQWRMEMARLTGREKGLGDGEEELLPWSQV